MKSKGKRQKAKGKRSALFLFFRENGVAFRMHFLLVAGCWLLVAFAQAQPRIAILDFNGESAVAAHLRKIVSQSQFTLIDLDQMDIALKGAKYNGSLNLSLDEARALGLSIGCDYYFLGLAKVLRRLATEKEFYFDVMIGAFLVETRSGQLIRFSFEKAQAANQALAQQRLTELTETIWRQCVDVIKSSSQEITNKHPVELATELYDLSSDEVVKLNLKPPQFYRRIKPDYTDTAEFAGVTATIELKAVFQADGRIGAVEVIRWGGFGLDESSVATVKQLRFEPAKLNGRSVNVSAVVQYNFRKEEKGK